MNQTLATAYMRQQVAGSSPVGLVIILLQEVTRRIVAARRALRERDYAEANRHFIKAQDIVYELRSAVNMDAGPMAEDLVRLYDFILGSLIKANLSQSDERLDTVLQIVMTLTSAWRELEERQ